MKQLTLREIAAWCEGTVAPEFEAVTVDGISTDSREIGKGQFFIPLVGSRYDGHHYIAKAMERGAAAVMTSKEIDATIPAVKVSDTLLAFGKLAANYRQYLNIKVIAITGSVGAGGLGNLAFRFGYQRYQKPVMYATVLLLILLVCVIQIIFDLAARKADKRTR